MKKLLIALFCVALPLSSMSFVHAQEKKGTANTSIKEDVFNDGEYAYGDGFQDIAEANPYARVEAVSYTHLDVYKRQKTQSTICICC